MTQSKKPAPVKVDNLPDRQDAQITEAMREDVPFVMGDGTEYVFKPVIDWSWWTHRSFIVGDQPNWLRGALKVNEENLDKTIKAVLNDHPGYELGRIHQYFEDMAGAAVGEGDSSSDS
ncbi:hypothetical protein GCM10023224_05040 [Streptomonospora halophila]|uniref:Tail assembly chaperone n=1 Tax=Streptomonospora halophila TaxID=427369 RepID=A0ABP9G5Q0_9ACTN